MADELIEKVWYLRKLQIQISWQLVPLLFADKSIFINFYFGDKNK